MDGKVVVVTGAGGGIGREIAVAMALEGALVVVNDIGASLAGEGGSATPGEQTVQIIQQRGGEAVASTDSVAGWDSARRIIQRTNYSAAKLGLVACRNRSRWTCSGSGCAATASPRSPGAG